jgi:streptogramin lyase
VTNYASKTGSVDDFAQDRDGIVWAGASSGLWRFDHSGWQHIGVEWNAPAGAVTQVGFDSEGILWALVGGFGVPKDLIYLKPGTGHFKTAGSNLSVEAFTWEANRAVLTVPVAPPMSDSGDGSDERLPAYPVLTKNLQIIDRNNSVWISLEDKPIVMRLPKDGLPDVQNKASPPISETYDINPFGMAELVDREGNIWFGDTRGIHRFFYTPLIRQAFPKEALGSADFAVAADDNGAVWISSSSSAKADFYHVLGGKAERRFPQGISSFVYRAPDKFCVNFFTIHQRTVHKLSEQALLTHEPNSDGNSREILTNFLVNLPHTAVSIAAFLIAINVDKQGSAAAVARA